MHHVPPAQQDLLRHLTSERIVELHIDFGDMPDRRRPYVQDRDTQLPVFLFRSYGEIYVAAQAVDKVCRMPSVRDIAFQNNIKAHKFKRFVNRGNQPVQCYTLKDVVRIFDIALKTFNVPDHIIQRYKTWRSMFNSLLLDKTRILNLTQNEHVVMHYTNPGWRASWGTHPEKATKKAGYSPPAGEELTPPATEEILGDAKSYANSTVKTAKTAREEVERFVAFERAAGWTGPYSIITKNKGEETHRKHNLQALLNAIDAIYEMDIPKARRRAALAQLLMDA